MKTRCLKNFGVALTCFFLFTANLNASTYTVPVGNNIQTYINMATNPGDIVQLETGTYPNQNIHITTSGITLQGTGNGSIIQSAAQASLTTCYTTPVFGGPSQGFCPFILVQNATDVTISNLTADGNNQGTAAGSNPVFQGIGYYNAGGTIQNVYVTNVANSDFPGGSQRLYAIAAITDTSPGVPYTVNVTGCTVVNFQKNAIQAIGNILNNPSFDSLIINYTNNTVTGPSSRPAANPNGIEAINGITGTISGNTVSNISDLTSSHNTSVGILIFDTNSINIENNTVFDNDSGISVYQVKGLLTISGNNIYDNNTNVASGGGLGLYVGDTTGTTIIENNILSNNVTVNLQIQEDSSSPSNQLYQVFNNQFIGSAVGLQVYGNNTTGPVITFNGDSFTGTTQYYVQEELSPNGVPNNIWPYLGPVSYDGLIPGQITYAQYEQIRTKIYDKLSPVFNPALGLVVDFVVVTPPSDFIGCLKQNKFLNRSEYILETTWKASSPGNAVLYRIYKNGVLYAEIPAGDSLVFKTCMRSRKDANTFSITSVNAAGMESDFVYINLQC